MTTTPTLDDMLQYAREWVAAGCQAHGFHVYAKSISVLADDGDIGMLVMAHRLLDGPQVSHQPYKDGDRDAWIVAVSGSYKGVYASAQGVFTDPEPALAALAREPIPGETYRGATDGPVFVPGDEIVGKIGDRIFARGQVVPCSNLEAGYVLVRLPGGAEDYARTTEISLTRRAADETREAP